MLNSLGLWISKNGLHLKLRLHQRWRSALRKSAILTEAMITWLIFELRLFYYCHFLISCRVSFHFVLRCFYKSYSSFLCRGENGKTFCLAELWPCINTRRASKILDLKACHILPLQVQLSGGLELKLPNFTLMVFPFRRMKNNKHAKPALIVRIHWDFTINAVHAFQNTEKKIILVSQTRPLKFISAPRKAKHFIGQLWQLMTASNVGERTQAWQTKWAVVKISRGLSASVSFLSFPPPPCSFTCAIFSAAVDSRSSFFAHRPHRNACYARYLFVFYPWQRLCMFGLF